MTAKPFLKWAGGKTVLFPEIVQRLPQKFGTYYEPFIGGGATFFALHVVGVFERAVIGDSVPDLMNAYGVVQRDPEVLLNTLKSLPINEESFYSIRASRPADRIVRAARTIYLNKTAFNGLYRVNKSGQFNTPWGQYKNPTLAIDENIRACSEALSDVTLVTGDFEDTISSVKRGDVVYFDPPYVPRSKTSSFTAYSAGGFTLSDHERLRNVAEKLSAKGVHVLLSNSDTPEVRELYDGFKIEKVMAPRRVNSKGSKRGNVGELLISGRRDV